MNNIKEIQGRLESLKNPGEVKKLMDSFQAVESLPLDLKDKIEDACLIFLDKFIKHLGSKRPTKSTITNLILQSTYKIQNDSKSDDVTNAFSETVSAIINGTFEGAFNPPPKKEKSLEEKLLNRLTGIMKKGGLNPDDFLKK